jgi:uncharacterized small protein (DUF1192 family)
VVGILGFRHKTKWPAMAGDDDEIFGTSPRKAATSHEIGQSVEDLSVQEIDEHIATLQAEITGLEERDEPNKYLPAPPPLFLSWTGRAQTSQWGLMIHGHSDRP